MNLRERISTVDEAHSVVMIALAANKALHLFLPYHAQTTGLVFGDPAIFQ